MTATGLAESIRATGYHGDDLGDIYGGPWDEMIPGWDWYWESRGFELGEPLPIDGPQPGPVQMTVLATLAPAAIAPDPDAAEHVAALLAALAAPPDAVIAAAKAAGRLAELDEAQSRRLAHARQHADVITTLSAREAAEQLGVTERTVCLWRAALRNAERRAA